MNSGENNHTTKVVFFGSESFSDNALRALITAGFDVVGVVTKKDSYRGRGRKLEAPQVKKTADSYDIPVAQPDKLRGINQWLNDLKPSVGVLASFGKFIPDSTLQVFRHGIVNIHPSMLPKHRGATPIESTILDGDAKAGVTLMRISHDMDAGPIFAQSSIDLSGAETSPELYRTLGDIGAKLLIEHLPAIVDGTLIPTTQDNHTATYCSTLGKKDGVVEPARQTACQIERRVRAFLAYPKSHLLYHTYDIILKKTHVVSGNANKSPMTVDCADDTKLAIDQLMYNGKLMSASDFYNGYIKN